MNKLEYIKLINSLRKANKNKWVSFTQNVENMVIGIKFFNTWIQVIEVNHGTHITRDSGCMDISVKQFNEFLNNAI